jgi:hypothetical protein
VFSRDARVRTAIGTWRDSLINLTGRNRLINFKPSRTGTVEIARPSADDVLSRIRMNRPYKFRSLKSDRPNLEPGEYAAITEASLEEIPIPPPAVDILDTNKEPQDLGAALRSLLRRSEQQYLDRGLWVLYLAFGSLKWIDEDRTRYTSPLLLVPVKLVSPGPKQVPYLTATDEDPAVNPALTLRLSQLGITLPSVDDLEEVNLYELVTAVRAAVADQVGWTVAETLVLSCFSFDKEAMYRDLLANEDLAAAHAAVATLACGDAQEGSDGGFYFEEIPEREIDQRAAPEMTPIILDADSSQRACVAAALDGRSFVMDGPPGTGKSQTIANMIGVLLQAGKNVLFVSEKAAALDVVRDRLSDAGLGSYLLELHSHKATRKEVAVALGNALDTIPVAPAPMPRMNLDTVRKRREQLNAYAEAINRQREPLGHSLHYVLGEIAKLKDVAAAPLTGIPPVDLTVQLFTEIKESARALAGAWRPASQGRSYIWRGVTEQGSLDAVLYQAESALRRLADMVLMNQDLADATGLTHPSDADGLAALLGHLSARPAGLPPSWLTAPTLNGAETAIADLGHLLDALARRGEEATKAAGTAWEAIPPAHALPLLDAALTRLAPPAVDTGPLSGDELAALADTFSADARMLQRSLNSLSGVASMLGLQAPTTFAAIDDVLAIAAIAEGAERPLTTWLTPPGLVSAREAARLLNDAHQELSKAEVAASAYYMPAALEVDVVGLAYRFEHDHHRLGKLSGEYRADKRSVAAFTREGVGKDVAQAQLPLAVAWKQATARLQELEMSFADQLGPYYTGRSTDVSQLNRALERAAMAINRAGGQNLARAANHVAHGVTPNSTITEITREVRRDLDEWRAALAPPPRPTARPELLNGTVTAAVDWLQAHLEPLGHAAAFTSTVSNAIGRMLVLREAIQLVQARADVEAAQASLAARETELAQVLGQLYRGTHTDLGSLRTALDWTRVLRMRMTGDDAPLSREQVEVTDTAIPTSHLADASQAWRQAKAALIHAFDQHRRRELDDELDDYADAAELIEALQQDIGGRDEWHAYQTARASLARHGLEVAIDFCIEERVDSGQVPEVIQRALLQEWAEHHLRTDPDLAIFRATDRDSLVREYQELDRTLIQASTGEIIRACNARRPRSDVGEAAIIRREAEKKKKHMPVRELIKRSRHVCQAIKPCFMMSPRAVSQYLPPDLHFDVVIFDEASQVTPGDAINCIYRGKSLILAGDQKQLPPPTFFLNSAVDDGDEWSEEADDSGDYDSVLDLAKASPAFRHLTLKWHYRSRHEALIVFSNYYFYKKQLVTFPSTQIDGPDVGVELFMVDGIYRRGTTRDNPAEALKVAERVIHHFDTRPSLSLGVVTFSEAQAQTVEIAVAEARQERSDLERFFETDRLKGFFVKSLENVQGDERDVLIFSIGYGPDENGKVTMHFGPLIKAGGWRRLNVAITRARYRNEIISSIHAGHIPESIPNEGTKHLRRYLDFAARGEAALALDVSSDGDAESPFEESVIDTIRSWGYDITPQVGTAGYRIDIGIRHPEYPGSYALGVECDGYQYHSAKAARDRDRLREQVLIGLGWRLHRIWGTAWYRDRSGEEHRLRTAIEQAILAPVMGVLGDADAPTGRPRLIVETEAASFDSAPTWALPYVTATVPPLPHWIDPSEQGSRFHMIEGVRVVVAVEAPIHVTVLHQRLRDAWNIGRVGPRIRENITAAVRRAGAVFSGDFIMTADAGPVTVRTPTALCARAIEQVHDHELALALVNLVRDVGGISRDDLTVSTARLYGWNRRGPDISSRLEALIDQLVHDGVLAGTAENLTSVARGEADSLMPQQSARPSPPARTERSDFSDWQNRHFRS